jgi:hypothetical protein
MIIIDYLYSTPDVYQKALDRTHKNKNKNKNKNKKSDEIVGSTLLYNENSYHITNIVYNEIIHVRFFLYKITKYIIEMWQN